jgi:hypothetical protein
MHPGLSAHIQIWQGFGLLVQGQRPKILVVVMAKYVDAVRGEKLEIAVIGCEPAVYHFDDVDAPLAQEKGGRFCFTLLASAGYHSNRLQILGHGGFSELFAVIVGIVSKSRLRRKT